MKLCYNWQVKELCIWLISSASGRLFHFDRNATDTHSRVVVYSCGPHGLISSVCPQVFAAQTQRRRAFHVQSSVQVAVGEHGVADA